MSINMVGIRCFSTYMRYSITALYPGLAINCECEEYGVGGMSLDVEQHLDSHG